MKAVYRCLFAVAAAAAPFAASAQDLDPTVVVDRAYEGKLMEVHKPLLEMAVPDSVMRFDLDFDYSVFENPYKGSYEFNPYLLSMKPSAAVDRPGRFYLRAGAGYQLRPELDAVWSPDLGHGPFRMDLYARHRSYIGDYISPAGGSDVKWSGYDMQSDAGLSLGYDWKAVSMGVDVGYCGLHQKSRLWNRGYNGLEASFGLKSKDVHAHGFVYEVSADYRLASESSRVNSGVAGGFVENDLDLKLMIGSDLKKHGRIRLDAGIALAAYSGDLNDAAADVSITPHYLYRKGILSADLGLRISKLTGRMFEEGTLEQIVYPDVEVRVNLFPKFLAFFAKAGGGNRLESNASLLERNHFANLLAGAYSMGVSVQRISASAGFEGRIGSRFTYNLSGGYADYASGVLDAVYPVYDGFMPGVGYAQYRSLHASLGWLWRSGAFESDGILTCTDAYGDAFQPSTYYVAPAAFTGDMSFRYIYRKRASVGLSCAFASAREASGAGYAVPAYADLGLSAEYVSSGSLSFWIKGGNLLGMTICGHPLYAVKGPYATVGISLKL